MSAFKAENSVEILPDPRTIKCFCCDLNWARFDRPFPSTTAAMASDWHAVDAKEYFDWHVEFGCNVIFCQAYLFGGTALYPSRLGPLAPSNGSTLLPRLYEMSRDTKMPFVSYFCAGADLTVAAHRPHWLVPGSLQNSHHGFLAPESPWTDLLCERISEFLGMYPVEWLLFDWFVYGSLHVDDFRVRRAWFSEKPFREITGRTMPEKAEEISAEENLLYKREMLARQFRAIRKAVRAASPGTKIMFNVPYWKPAEDVWKDHPMLLQSDALFAECSREDVVEWLLSVRRPRQRVMTTIIGRVDSKGECDPETWRKWHERGLDFFGYAWGTPPDFRPHPDYKRQLQIVRRAFRAIG